MRSPHEEAELAHRAGVTLVPLDISDRQQIDAAVAKAVSLGGVDVVFNNAGYGLAGPWRV